MAQPQKPAPVKLICGIIFAKRIWLNKAKELLESSFGEIEEESEIYNFSKFSDYYDKELRGKAKKQIVSFKKLIDRDELVSIKEHTNELEEKKSRGGKRNFNLDPGYLTEHNIILASAKEMPHKVSLGKGIFGDVVLTYTKGGWKEYFRSFADYQSKLVKNFLTKLRKKYQEEKKKV